MFRYLSLLFIFAIPLIAQIADTIKYQWPFAPMNVQKEVTGTVGEYRSTSVEGHYHNGTDVPAPANTPCLAVLDGTVIVAYDDGGTGYDSYVRIASTIGGQIKYLTYYHTRPTVSVGQNVTVGQMISRVAIDHVHLIDYRIGAGISNTQLNSLRPDGGFTPYVDTWKPRIRYVKFLVDNSSALLAAQAIGGKVDIIVHVEEENGVTSSAKNNGTYEVGYRILSADSSSVVYNPPDNGIRYRYYNIPRNEYVNFNYYKPESSTSQHVYNVTNGTGASSVATTQVVSNNYFNAASYPDGNYVVNIFTIDSRGNKDSVLIPIRITEIDQIPPEAPVLNYIKKDTTNYFVISWTAPPDSDLKGYRLMYSTDGINYIQRDGESVLTRNVTRARYMYPSAPPLYLKLYAVDTAYIPNVSIQSDVYGVKMSNTLPKLLIVDGFDRYGVGSNWNKSFHDFIIRFGEVIPVAFDVAHHSYIENDSINLRNYPAVLWMAGDNAHPFSTLDSIEQLKIKDYLINGGKFFISGSELAWDLVDSEISSHEDSLFLVEALKSRYVSNDANSVNVLGMQGSFMAGQNIQFGLTSQGSPYIEDAPDIIDTSGGSSFLFKYSETSGAGIYYTGTFYNSPLEGQLVYLAFPFETIGYKSQREMLMNGILNYFGIISTGLENSYKADLLTSDFLEIYPNPVSGDNINISFNTNAPQKTSLRLYSVLGQQLFEVPLLSINSGINKIKLDFSTIRQLSSGMYIVVLNTGSSVISKKFVVIR